MNRNIMKKKHIFLILCICLCIGIAFWAIGSDKNKNQDFVFGDSYQSAEDSGTSDIDPSAGDTGTLDAESGDAKDVVATQDGNRIVLQMPCENSADKTELEILDWVFIPDTELAGHTEYKTEFYHENKVPEVDAEREITYAFFKCKWRNNNDHKVNSDIDLSGFIEAKDVPYLALCCFGNSYFDKPEHTDGEDRDHHFFWRTLEVGEELECTIGFPFDEPQELEFSKKEGRTYYIGRQPVDRDYFTIENTRGYIVPLIDKGDVNN